MCGRRRRGRSSSPAAPSRGCPSTIRASMPSTPASSRSRRPAREGCAMRREGSPWQGLGTVVLKELADHFDSVRVLLLSLLMVLAAAVPLYGAITSLRDTTAEDPFL